MVILLSKRLWDNALIQTQTVAVRTKGKLVLHCEESAERERSVPKQAKWENVCPVLRDVDRSSIIIIMHGRNN